MSTALKTLLNTRDEAAARVAALKEQRRAGGILQRDDANARLPDALRALQDLDRQVREARREERDRGLQARRGELQPAMDALAAEIEQLVFALGEFNALYTAVRDKAVALGARVGARAEHPLSAANVEHTMRAWALANLAPRFPGAGDIPKGVPLLLADKALFRAD